jgi:tRNA A-37 threonylcarbamoyl transferase component Bud32
MHDEDAKRAPEPAAPTGGEGSAGRRAVTELLGDRYEIVRKLGSGAFGEVYEATDTSLGRKVAIKRIRLDAFAEGPELQEVKQRFLQEAQVAAKLRHPNVVTIHDIAAKGSSSFMVMELVEGQTLQALLRDKGRLGLEETLRLLSQAAAALDFAHANGVIHRDVKPANLMIEPSGQVKVMDFGIAKAAASGNITRTGAILGTPNYMAPEQARGGQVDGRADLFSLGCVLYECLTGRRPFVGDSVTAILLKILNEAPPAVDFEALKLPRPLEEVLRRALAKDPAERYPTGGLLIEAAAEATGAQAVPAPLPTLVASAPPPPATSASAPRQGVGFRKRALIGLAGVVVLGGLVWTARAALRAPGAAGASPGTRLTRFVTKQEPGFLGRLVGAKPKLHITVPGGSSLRVRLETPLSSETARSDQEFTASTSTSVEVDGYEALPAGSRVKGHVAHAAGSGKVSGRGELTLEFDRIVLPGGTQMLIEAEPLQRMARSTAKKDTAKVAGAAGLGAIVGGILGGGKGAAIGGAVGGSAGTGVVLATKGEEVVLPTGTLLDVRLRSALTVTVEAASK